MNFLLSLIFCLFPILASAANEKPKDNQAKLLLKSMSLRYADLKTWKAKFTQETINPALGTNSFSEGEFAFQSPNKFRFSVLNPEASDFISNGKEAWHVLFKNGRKNAGFVKHFKNVSTLELDRYLILLRGVSLKNPKEEADFFKKFLVEGTTEGDVLKLKLSPKKSSEIADIIIETKNNDKVPYLMTLVDALGVTTKIRIVGWEKVKNIDPKEFTPAIPAGSTTETY